MNVTLANGTSIPASEVKPGDIVLSYNLATHELQPSVVSAVKALTADNKYIINGKLDVDGTELLYINGKWARAYTAKIGDMLFDPITGKQIKITSIQILDTGGTVYDLIGTPVNDYIGNGFLIDKDTTLGDSCTSEIGASLITMANGSVVQVQNLHIGDMVLSYNLQTQKIVPSVVVSVKSLYANNEYIINGNLTVDSGEDLIVNGTNELAKSLKIGDKLFDPLTNNTVTVRSIEIINNISVKMYDVNTAPIDDSIVDGYLIT
ncbi:MAG: hypothetical protein QXS17_01930 [Candidatus Micrarchaeaceae archaeon]